MSPEDKKLFTDAIVAIGEVEQDIRDFQRRLREGKELLVEALADRKMHDCLTPNIPMLRNYINAR